MQLKLSQVSPIHSNKRALPSKYKSTSEKLKPAGQGNVTSMAGKQKGNKQHLQVRSIKKGKDPSKVDSTVKKLAT